jgi:hypothetical protein
VKGWETFFVKQVFQGRSFLSIAVAWLVLLPCCSEGRSPVAEYDPVNRVWHPKLERMLETSRKTLATEEPGLPKGLSFPEPSTLRPISGTENLIRIAGERHVEIKDLMGAVTWKRPRHRKHTTLIIISDCDEVILDNVHLLQLDKDFRAAHTVIFEDCARVVVKNSSFRGACTYHLRIEGAQEILIDSVEISGSNNGSEKTRCGGGIFINNGDDKPGKYKMRRGQYTSNPYDLVYFAILNSWFHDSLDDEQRENVDGVLVHSGAHGLISNCRFQDWQGGDAALDISHRRVDKGYDRKLIRVERNVFVNCRFVKSVGRSNGGCSIIWCNNLYSDTVLADYHQGYSVYHISEDILFKKSAKRFLALWGLRDGLLKIEYCLFLFPAVKTYIHQGKAGTPTDYRWISSDNNIFYLGNPIYWVLGQGVSIENISDWQNTGNDRNSFIKAMNPEMRHHVITTGDYRDFI